MRSTRAWIAIAGACVVVGALVVIRLAKEVSNCQYREDSPIYSSDRKFYAQMQLTVCRDRSKSHARLVMGAAGKHDKNVLMELGPSIGTLNLSWHDGPELDVQVAESVITKRYGPYEDLPRMVISNPNHAGD